MDELLNFKIVLFNIFVESAIIVKGWGAIYVVCDLLQSWDPSTVLPLECQSLACGNMCPISKSFFHPSPQSTSPLPTYL